MILFSYLQPLLFSSKTETISYSQFKQYVDQGIAGELVIGPENIQGTLAGSPKRAFATVRVNDPDLVKELDEGKISYSGRYENRFLSSLLSWILPLGIIFLIWRFAMKKMGTGMGVMSFSKSKAKIFAESDTKVSFADVAGIDEAKEELQEVVEFLKLRRSFRNWGAEYPKGCCWSARREPAKPFWPGPWPGRPKCLFFQHQRVRVCGDVCRRRERPAFAIFSLRPPTRRPVSSSSMNWMPWAKPGG
jgi:ATP-dependent Zn protease